MMALGVPRCCYRTKRFPKGKPGAEVVNKQRDGGTDSYSAGYEGEQHQHSFDRIKGFVYCTILFVFIREQSTAAAADDA